MTVIAGLAGFPARRAHELCARMLDDLRAYADSPAQLASRDEATLGIAVRKRVPEDDDDDQPIALPDGGLLVADIRIDNREELAAALGLSGPETRERADSWLLARAWLKWEESCFARIVGDYALAIWNDRERELLLARSPLGARPLYYSLAGERVAFASLPSALIQVPDCAVEVDQLAVAANAVRLYQPRHDTIYRNVLRLEPARLVRIRRGAVRSEPFWTPDSAALDIGLAEAGQRLRDVLGTAVAARLRSPSGKVAAQLSAGRDSSAVAVTAAALLAQDGERLLAFTGAPSAEANLPEHPHELFDEGALAALIASPYPNILHHISRPGESFGLDLLARMTSLNNFPIPITSNLPWQAAIANEARAAGADVLLNGQFGNGSISLGGPEFLPDLLAESGVGSWASSLWQMTSHRPLTLARRAARTLAPDAAYRRIARRKHSRMLGELLLTGEALEAIGRRDFVDAPPARRSARAELAAEVVDIDHGQVVSLAMWGLDPRDPTADRRVVELCMRLPAATLIGPNRQRPAYAAAFGQLLPPEVVAATRRGYQGADWFRQFRPSMVEEALEAIRGSAFASMVRMDRLRPLLAAWPTEHSDDAATYSNYRIGVLGLLAAAVFLQVRPSAGYWFRNAIG